MNKFCKKRLKASFTVEASLIFPMIIFAMARCINVSIELHEEVKETAYVSKQVREFNAFQLLLGERLVAEVISDE